MGEGPGFPAVRVRRDPTSGDWRAWSLDALASAKELTRDVDLARELAQETLLRLVRWHKDVRQIHPWIVTVIRRLATSKKDPLLEQEPISGVFLPLPSLDSEEFGERIDFEKAMEALPARQRVLLRLVEAGFLQREIATILGCKVKQVGPRVARAQQALRRRLARDSRSAGPQSDGV